MRTPEPVVGEFLFRPFIRLFQILRPCQSLSDHVGKIFQVRHDPVVVMPPRQNLFVRRSKWIFRRRRALLRPQHHAATHNHCPHHTRHKSIHATCFHRLRVLRPVRASFENIRFYARRTTSPVRFQPVLTSTKCARRRCASTRRQQNETRPHRHSRSRQNPPRLRNLLAPEKIRLQRRTRHRSRAPIPIPCQRRHHSRRPALDSPRANRRRTRRRPP